MSTEAPVHPQIPRQPVVSSNIKSVGYNPDSKTLAIEFMNGHVWHYAGVDASVHQQLLAAESKGSYFARSIRRRYTETRVA